MKYTQSKNVEQNYFNCKGKPSILKIRIDEDYAFELQLKQNWNKNDLQNAIGDALTTVDDVVAIKVIHFESIELDKTLLN